MISPDIGQPSSLEGSHEDEVLVRQCLLGDEKSWSTLIRKYSNLIFSIPIKRGLSRDDASDIFQSVCVALLGSLASIREPKALAGWVIQTTAHACDRLQSQSQRLKSIDPEQERTLQSHDSPDRLIRQLEHEQLIRQTVASLSPECRKLIELLFLSDTPIPYETAAAELGLAKGSIGPTRMRCLDKLRRSLEEKGFR